MGQFQTNPPTSVESMTIGKICSHVIKPGRQETPENDDKKRVLCSVRWSHFGD